MFEAFEVAVSKASFDPRLADKGCRVSYLGRLGQSRVDLKDLHASSCN